MDTTNVGRGPLIAGVSGVLLFIFMFFSWYGADVSAAVPAGVPEELAQQAEDAAEQAGVETPSFSAWESFDFTDLVLLLAVIVAVGVAVIELTGASISLPVAGSALTAGIGAIAFLFVLYRLIDPPANGLDREIGVWLGLITTAGIAVGGYLGMQEEGTSFTDVRDQVSPPR
jgi:hypothetical protein